MSRFTFLALPGAVVEFLCMVCTPWQTPRIIEFGSVVPKSSLVGVTFHLRRASRGEDAPIVICRRRDRILG